ncbi:baeRF2 domain-containing protein [Streptomyces sp. MUM 178J]|uniref:baeRF2 domain-containing protein n=1 Tax=Streptomyces sp. MUM 178J TaxID=2791991 RepID=UPI001F045494|nr:Vms1/Ankzf1 family peptidyl-tRNA hydrolase [Streptomyces sp. MUM 178J]WRQ78086.1 Vms1/Ankzf1 family peptidyl-tRNA hydrolase [Streptomyces sp. MUM 178J]
MRLEFLTPLYERPGPWASVHLDTEWGDRDTPARRELQAREVCRTLAEKGADQQTGHAVYAALTAFGGRPGEAGRAVYATGGEVVLDPPLTHRPAAPMDVTWAALPHVAPLLDLAAQEPVCLVVYVDRTGADLELRTPLGAADAGSVVGEDWPLHRTASADWSERHHQQRVENTWEQNAQEIAEAVTGNQEEYGADLIVLAGDPYERRAVHERLPAALQPYVVETEHGGRAEGAGSRLLDADVERARQEHLSRRAEEELDRFRAAHEAAAEGVPALVEAAREHRIEELFIRPEGADAQRRVWVGEAPDQLAMLRTDAQYLGARDPDPARADDALLRSAAVTGAEALRVPAREPEDASPAGGLGALLRRPAHAS